MQETELLFLAAKARRFVIVGVKSVPMGCQVGDMCGVEVSKNEIFCGNMCSARKKM